MRALTSLIRSVLQAMALLASGMAWADVPEMFGCGAIGRLAVVETDGSITQKIAPEDMAQIYIEHCDFVALGRFSAITVIDYEKRSPSNVKALFATDEVLLGPELAGVRVSVAGGMLVQPGESVSRNTAKNVYNDDAVVQIDLTSAIIEDLRDLHRNGARLTDERLATLEEKVGKLRRPRPGRIDRRTELTIGHRNIAIGWGTTFYQEGGAVSPNTRFLLGLDVTQHDGPAYEQLSYSYMLLHWGDYAESVAGAIRAANQ